VIKAVRKSQPNEEFPAPFDRRQARPAGDELRQHNILQSVEFWEKMVKLVNETDSDAAHAGARLVVESRTVSACNISFALGRPFEKTGNMEQ
jgi:hypothetical protein